MGIGEHGERDFLMGANVRDQEGSQQSSITVPPFKAIFFKEEKMTSCLILILIPPDIHRYHSAYFTRNVLFYFIYFG